jgi:hypothetical protein
MKPTSRRLRKAAVLPVLAALYLAGQGSVWSRDREASAYPRTAAVQETDRQEAPGDAGRKGQAPKAGSAIKGRVLDQESRRSAP